MAEGETLVFDQVFLLFAQRVRDQHPGWVEVMRDLTGLGGVAVLTLLTILCAGYLVVTQSRLKALLLVVAVSTGSIGVSLLKAQFERSRPDPQFAQFVLSGMSFPSGHAAMSTVVYLTLGALLANARTRRVEQIYLAAMAILIAILVGISRVFLGVHWATDVVAGWAIGAAWALLWWWLEWQLNQALYPLDAGTTPAPF